MSRRRSLAVDTRGVSETLGYVLVFSIIITTITTASVFGFGGLENRQAVEETTNVERAFDVMADNFADISRYDDPSRATEIRLAGGTIGFDEPVTVTVGQWNSTTDSFEDNESVNVTFQPLEFQGEGGNVVYEAGVVFRVDGSRSIARSPLPFVVGEETALVPTVATIQDTTTTAVGGEQTILVVGERRSTVQTLANRTIEADGNELRVRIESPRADGWSQRLESAGYRNVSYEPDDEAVSAELAVERDGSLRQPDRVRLPITFIQVRFD